VTMSSIYTHAFLTIVAVRSRSVDDGLSLTRREKLTLALPVDDARGDGPELVLYLVAPLTKDIHSEMTGSE
jgi:hypothetical protein